MTVWEPYRELAFEVTSEPPSLTELSPFQHVHSPHVHGYFATHGGSFRMERLPDGHTRLVEHTRHALRLAPFQYWLPMARWVVR